MPFYDYVCTQCKNEFEVFQSMKDEALTTCEKCGGKVRRIITGGTGVIFKGSGFYVNDSKKSTKAASKAPSSTSSVSADSSSTVPVSSEKSDSSSEKVSAPNSTAPSTSESKAS